MPGNELAAARHAHQCLEIAHTITNRNARAALIEMSQVWQRLADQQDASLPGPRPEQTNASGDSAKGSCTC
jgi:hypothetical protein